VSSEAGTLEKVATKQVEFSEESQALFGDKVAALSQLWTLARECGQPDWDGAGASPIDINAVMNSHIVICALPANIPMPELAPDPDGEVSFDWMPSRHRIFSVSIGAGPLLAYAWLDGNDKGHGVAQFDGTTIPERIIEGIRRILRYGNITVRPSFHCR